MKNNFLIFLMCLLFPYTAYGGTVTAHTVYGTTSQVTSTTLNGNVNNILNAVNAGLDNDNANTSGGFRFVEVVGALPSAGTQGRVVFLTTNDTLNFDNGSDWVSTVNPAGTPSQGDVLYYDGSNWVRLGAGTSGQVFNTQGASSNPVWADTTIVPKIGSFTRNMTSASGSQAITGVGFAPKAIVFFGAVGGTTSGSWGFSDGTNKAVLFRDDGTADETISTSFAINIQTDVSKSQVAVIASFDSDGFTLTWTKAGSPTGTATIGYLAFQ